MPSCVFKTCKNKSTGKKKDCGVTYHRFLSPDHEKREAWIKIVQKNRNENTWLPSPHTVICSDHFKKEDKYITKTGRVYLKKCAVPYDISSEAGTLNLEEAISETVSDSDSIFDTPQVIVLKRKLIKESTARKRLAEKFKKIQRQNRYLKKRCKYYNFLVKDLKNKFDTQTANNLTHRAEVVGMELPITFIKKEEEDDDNY